MITLILILLIINLFLTGFLFIRDYHRTQEAEMTLSNISSIESNLLNKTFTPPSPPYNYQDESPDPNSAFIHGHILEDIATNDPNRESSEEREYISESKASFTAKKESELL